MRSKARFSLPRQVQHALQHVKSERIVFYGRSAKHLQYGLCSDRRGSGIKGFEYRPSKHSLVRRDDDLTREIMFQSSRRNFTIPDQGVGGAAFYRRD